MFSSRLSFVMTAVGAAVGLGNLFRFPALCVRYGSAYILVYIMLLFVVGIPLLLSEIALGRMFGQNATFCFVSADRRALPLGFLASVNAFIIMTYYCVLFAFVVLAATFSYKLIGAQDAAAVFSPILFPKTFSPVLFFALVFSWGAVFLCFGDAKRLGAISTVSVIAACLIIFGFSAFCAVKSGGKIFSFLAFRPTVFTLSKFWIDALGQVFFSLSLMVGVLVSYGACLNKKEGIVRCGVAVALCDLAVSLCGTVIYVAAKESEGSLFSSFSAYPAAFSALGHFGAAVCFLFYLSVGFLCLASLFAYLKSACEFFVFRVGGNETAWALGLSLISLFFGSFLLWGRGLEFLKLIDGEVIPVLIILLGLAEVVLFNRPRLKSALLQEINKNEKHPFPRRLFSLSLGVFAPLTLFVLLIYGIFFQSS